MIYVPITAAILRIEDAQRYCKDEIDAIYINMASDDHVAAAGVLVRGLLDATHHDAGDFSVIVPAELLAQQQRTRRPVRVRHGGDRVDLAARRRHRHHEHHARERDGAHARDRRAPRGRRPRKSTSSASS